MDTVVEQKTNDLGRFLAGKPSTLELVKPAPKLERQDNRELRARILGLRPSEANRLGIQKSTLHYLRRKASSSRGFRLYKPMPEKIMHGS
jgi:hypothetical protein